MGADPHDGDSGTNRASEPDAQEVLSLVLPSVLDGLGAEARRTRVSAAWTACRLADERPTLGAELADRLVKAADRTPTEPLVRTLSSLHERHPERVGDALRRFDGKVVRAVRKTTSWDFDAELRADGGGAVAAEPKQVVDAPNDGVTVHQRSIPDEPTPPTAPDDSEPDEAAVEHADASIPDAATGDEDTIDPVAERRRRIQAAENSQSFAAVQLVSAFDEVSVIEPPRRGRYGHVLPSKARMEQAEYGIDLLFFDKPGDDATAYGSAVHERLGQWQAADETTGIAAVADYGDHPRPWVATPRTESTLADRDPPELGVALRDARELAAGLAAVTERGLVHGGIDPHDVVYPAAGFESDPAPSLSHLGVMTVIRDYFDPVEYLDPRYAAPEYFDDRFGQIDHATDVYHLGAVIYRLFAGQPPYDGEYATVRESILADGTPVPSDVRPNVPESIDEVVAKAMAPRKLTRFETATQLYRQLKHVG
ncbi:serine/threonine protein kinase [Halorhabdus sp. CUG00001]|uniref:serine/threonine protein kinase n=1 Tax=Halorhabdus sp. CUG00001 TaxID=2600297 RepID=UPI00131E5F61|nr:serine/threonine protein kinase [Halorhabdus sp. CUG00001]